jgi:D-sedoheptulose 7-phosphate isomerase
VNLDMEDMSLVSCSAEFGAMLERCEVTDRGKSVLGLESGLQVVMRILADVRENGSHVYIVGNGGSAGVASHAAIDLFNVAKLRALTLHESSLLTCMANDYGYENAFARTLAQLTRPGDVLIAISSSGCSHNIRNAAAQATNNGGTVITFTGFARDNPLRLVGDINIWLDSSDYGQVEIGHQFILHNISDRFGAGYGETATS